MATRGRTYIWQFTIGLGFLSGLWSAIGIDPKDVILNLLGMVTGEIFPDPRSGSSSFSFPFFSS